MKSPIPSAFCVLAIIVLAYSAWSAPAQYPVHTITLSSTVRCGITLGPDKPVNEPTYITPDGEWKRLEVKQSAAGTSFSLPQGTAGSTIILLDKPKWLTLPDTEAPLLKAAAIGKDSISLSHPHMDAGHFFETPSHFVFTVADELNPINGEAIAVLIDGRNISEYGGNIKIDQSADGKRADIIITPGDLPRQKHKITISVPDATPRRNTLDLGLAFSTAPLIANAGFENANANLVATGWRYAAWGQNKETKWKTIVAKGEGRTGSAVKMTGIAGKLYLIVGQQCDLVAGQTYIFSGWYRSEAEDGCGVSLVGPAVGDLKQQYVESPILENTAQWTPFSWEVTPEAGHTSFEIFVFSKGKGASWFDDLELMPKE